MNPVIFYINCVIPDRNDVNISPRRRKLTTLVTIKSTNKKAVPPEGYFSDESGRAVIPSDSEEPLFGLAANVQKKMKECGKAGMKMRECENARVRKARMTKPNARQTFLPFFILAILHLILWAQ